MCGIVGFVGPGDRSVLAVMTAALAHRGPDGEGMYCDPETAVHLGHRRLAIVDLVGGAQPMWNEDDRIAVIYNGEVYNHRELRAELIRRGHVFRTDHSDTEVLVHGYEEWGEDLPRRLNGMFAFAVYDRPRHRLFLARDRFGEKPLYYCQGPGFFAFSSELQALRRHPLFDARLSTLSLQKFFAYGYLPAPNAIYANSRKLPGGGQLTYDVATGELKVGAYWRFAIEPDPYLTDDQEERLAEELRHLLVQAIERRLMSDVPLGVFLSGGVDSASVLAGARQILPQAALKTFTIGFVEPSFDETAAARATARYFATEHHEQLLSLDTAKRLIPQVLTRLDEPLGDPSVLPSFLLSRFTREQVTVALSGDGGDELFAGYDPFRALAPARWYFRLMPRAAHRGIRRLVDLLPPSVANMSWDFKLKRGLTGLSYPPMAWNPVWMAPIEPAAIGDVFYEPLRWEDLYSEAIALWQRDPRKSIIDRTLEFFTTFYLQDDILAKVDRTTMMCSLESRAIFLDNDVVDFCRRLPSCFKYRCGQRKYLLKKAMAPLLPQSVLVRPKKGFGVPLAKWLRSFPPEPPWAGVEGIDQSQLQRSWRAHQSGSHDNRIMLWCWLALQALLAGDRVAEMTA
jgi:asparagine synthase (glutamine-hydrolysing)